MFPTAILVEAPERTQSCGAITISPKQPVCVRETHRTQQGMSIRLHIFVASKLKKQRCKSLRDFMYDSSVTLIDVNTSGRGMHI
jgi:hypothetical protein